MILDQKINNARQDIVGPVPAAVAARQDIVRPAPAAAAGGGADSLIPFVVGANVNSRKEIEFTPFDEKQWTRMIKKHKLIKAEIPYYVYNVYLDILPYTRLLRINNRKYGTPNMTILFQHHPAVIQLPFTISKQEQQKSGAVGYGHANDNITPILDNFREGQALKLHDLTRETESIFNVNDLTRLVNQYAMGHYGAPNFNRCAKFELFSIQSNMISFEYLMSYHKCLEDYLWNLLALSERIYYIEIIKASTNERVLLQTLRVPFIVRFAQYPQPYPGKLNTKIQNEGISSALSQIGPEQTIEDCLLTRDTIVDIAKKIQLFQYEYLINKFVDRKTRKHFGLPIPKYAGFSVILPITLWNHQDLNVDFILSFFNPIQPLTFGACYDQQFRFVTNLTMSGPFDQRIDVTKGGEIFLGQQLMNFVAFVN